MKRQYWLIGILSVLLCVTAWMIVWLYGGHKDETWISRSAAAKMSVLAKDGPDGIATDSLEEGQAWYSPYIERSEECFGLGPESGEMVDLWAMEPLTYGEAKKIAGAFEVQTEFLSFSFDAGETRPIPASQWFELYDLIAARSGHVKKQELLILGTSSNVEGLSSWQCLTQEGLFSFVGLSLDSYMDTCVFAYVCGGEIGGINGVCPKTVQVNNVWITSGDQDQMTVFINGYYRVFELDRILTEPVEKVMADMTFEDRELSKITLKPTVIKGTILSVDDESIDIENYGKVATTEDFIVLNMEQGITCQGRDSLSAGSMYTEFVVEDQKICAALIRASSQEETIRVLLSCDGYTGYIHSGVTLTSSVPFWTVCQGERREYQAGEMLTIDLSALAGQPSMTVFTSATAGTIEILSLNRSQGHPRYRGALEIIADDQGLVLVNELLMEDYLYGVIPSEMPASYEMEALKTQAVCARSFAAASIQNPRFPQWDADVDDSMATQVYNNADEDSRTCQAVDETAGQALVWEGEPVQAYFYSTSSGSSSDPEDVWISGNGVPYIHGRLQILGEEERDLSSEDVFKSFIDDYASKDYFEKDISWFRWETTLSSVNIRESVDKSLLTRIRTVPSQILVMDEGGSFVEKEISTVGDIIDLYVRERSESGVIKSMVIEGTEAVILVQGEYNIRLLLAPLESLVLCHDGTDAGTMTMLPSGYFYIEAQGDQIYTLRGGGYGHGTGMSQNGVLMLANRGLDCYEILHFYFEDVAIENLREP
ncbi:stage II sporulation protein D [Catenibacillus scindens]|uniref:Stage II sporulation protein D n=1 Tax=Catenibacillus scindens TaxID=673271 RepID=A0A7W8HB34_9FIRM|nr:SpoIID/LytB domain-containing protein [Catenibacillus scindens]MBB5265184.1 stage II sporulation protein D [Catenibacillus scindens]